MSFDLIEIMASALVSVITTHRLHYGEVTISLHGDTIKITTPSVKEPLNEQTFQPAQDAKQAFNHLLEEFGTVATNNSFTVKRAENEKQGPSVQQENTSKKKAGIIPVLEKHLNSGDRVTATLARDEIFLDVMLEGGMGGFGSGMGFDNAKAAKEQFTAAKEYFDKQGKIKRSTVDSFQI